MSGLKNLVMGAMLLGGCASMSQEARIQAMQDNLDEVADFVNSVSRPGPVLVCEVSADPFRTATSAAKRARRLMKERLGGRDIDFDSLSEETLIRSTRDGALVCVRLFPPKNH